MVKPLHKGGKILVVPLETDRHLLAYGCKDEQQHRSNTLSKSKNKFFSLWPTDPKQGSSYTKSPIHRYEDDLP